MIPPQHGGEGGAIPAGLCQCGCGKPTTIAKQTETRRDVVRGQPHHFFAGHRGKPNFVEQFLARIEKTETCWLWRAHIGSDGYGQAYDWTRRRMRRAHIVAYELLIGPVPEGMTLDHDCHNEDDACPGGSSCRHRSCVNPAHLEPRTLRDNTLNGKATSAVNARKTHCYRGHEFTPENTRWTSQGHRCCRTCSKQWRRDRYHADREHILVNLRERYRTDDEWRTRKLANDRRSRSAQRLQSEESKCGQPES